MSTVYVIENGVVVTSFFGYATTAEHYKPETEDEEIRLIENSKRIKAIRHLSDSLDDVLQKQSAERKTAVLQRLDALQTFCKQIESFSRKNNGILNENNERNMAASLVEIWNALKSLGEKDFSSMSDEETSMVERELEKLYEQIKERPEAMLYSRKVQMTHMKQYLSKNGWKTAEVIQNEDKSYMMVRTSGADRSVIVFEKNGSVTVLSNANDSVHRELHLLVEASLRSLQPNINAHGTCMHGTEAKKEETRILQNIHSAKKNKQNIARSS